MLSWFLRPEVSCELWIRKSNKHSVNFSFVHTRSQEGWKKSTTQLMPFSQHLLNIHCVLGVGVRRLRTYCINHPQICLMRYSPCFSHGNWSPGKWSNLKSDGSRASLQTRCFWLQNTWFQKSPTIQWKLGSKQVVWWREATIEEVREKRHWCRGRGSSSGRLLEPGRMFRRPWRTAGIKKMKKDERYQQGKVVTMVTIYQAPYQVEPSSASWGWEHAPGVLPLWSVDPRTRNGHGRWGRCWGSRKQRILLVSPRPVL